MEAVVLFTEAPKNDGLAKSIYEGGWKIPTSEKRFTEAVVLRKPPPKITTTDILFTVSTFIAIAIEATVWYLHRRLER